MIKRSQIISALSLSMLAALLSGCGKDFNGFGEYEGWGGYTKQFGDTEGYGNKEVGLCSYTGGCMPESSDDSTSVNSYKRSGDRSGAGAGADDSGN